MTRRKNKQLTVAEREPANVSDECYYKKNWLGQTVEKSDVELWDQYALVPEAWMDFDD